MSEGRDVVRIEEPVLSLAPAEADSRSGPRLSERFTRVIMEKSDASGFASMAR